MRAIDVPERPQTPDFLGVYPRGESGKESVPVIGEDGGGA